MKKLDQQPHILSVSSEELRGLLAEGGHAGFRFKQVWAWIYEKRTLDLDAMSNVSGALKEWLRERFEFGLPKVVDRVESADGSTKLLLESSKGQAMETVLMRYAGRTSLCVSSQVGCKLACDFCQTGKLGFVSHLTAADILGQFLVASSLLEPDEKKISHVVFMGMGEPFDNYAHTMNAANRMIDSFGLTPRNVTLSTSGVVPRIYDFIHDCPGSLAISLHASRDDLRTSLMPINRKYPLQKLKEALLAYQKATGKVITLEYILIAGVNAGRREVKELVKFIHGLKVKVNLIPFNAHPGMPFERPTEEEIREFQSYLAARSIPAPVRYSKGLDVSAACGQLAAKAQSELALMPDRKRLVQLRPEASRC